jgi:hypothetical protein
VREQELEQENGLGGLFFILFGFGLGFKCARASFCIGSNRFSVHSWINLVFQCAQLEFLLL